MAYIKTVWKDLPDETTPLSADNLNHMEDGIYNASFGWQPISATLTYASADSPTFVANTSVDLTSFISVGIESNSDNSWLIRELKNMTIILDNEQVGSLVDRRIINGVV